MKGRVYPTWKRDRAGKLVLDADGNKILSGYNVRFGRDICRHFTELIAAERFLTGLRFKTDEGSFDLRDYRKDNPLGFKNQAKKWLEKKKQITKPKHYANLNRYMQAAS